MSNVLFIESLNISQFKGIHSLSIPFDPISTNIWGDNGTGKTSVSDAIHYLLHGKNSMGEASFGVRPVDKNNSEIEDAQTEVSGVINFNGRKIKLRHVYKAVFRRKRGADKDERDGNTHEYFVDGAPYKEAEYKAYINNLVDESIFPLITNPVHFARMPWQKGREIILKVAGEISNADLIAINPDFQKIIDQLVNGKKLSKYREEVKANIRDCKQQQEGIPERIDEVRRGMPDEENYEEVKAAIDSRKRSLDKMDEELTSVTKASQQFTETVREHERNVRALRIDQDKVASDIRTARTKADLEEGKELRQKKNELTLTSQHVTDAQNSIDTQETRKKTLEASIKQKEQQKVSISERMDRGREEWKTINAETLVFGEGAFECPTCHQSLPEDEIETKKEELRNAFSKDKADRLAVNIQKGTALKKDLTALDSEVAAINKELATVESMIIARTQEKEIHIHTYDKLVDEIRALESRPAEAKPDIEDLIKEEAEYIALENKIAELLEHAPKEEEKDLSESKARRLTLTAELDDLKKKLNVKELRATAEKRITELKEQEKDLAHQLNKLEGTENLIEKFIKAQIDALTGKVNDRFKIVKFKMFNCLQNGGIDQTCEITVDGVPYSDLNTAKKINAGIDVINVLSEHYGITAPIVVDNRESIVDLLSTPSQVINLIVWEAAKKLTVSERAPKTPEVKPAQAELAML
jgi:exonuclease SbcC